MAVSDELRDLKVFLTAAPNALRVGGCSVVGSYQSPEDRLVKQAFTPGVHPGVPWGLPMIPAGCEPWLQNPTRGTEKADVLELQRNPRSQSVRLRAVAKLRKMAPREPRRPNPNPASRRK